MKLSNAFGGLFSRHVIFASRERGYEAVEFGGFGDRANRCAWPLLGAAGGRNAWRYSDCCAGSVAHDCPTRDYLAHHWGSASGLSLLLYGPGSGPEGFYLACGACASGFAGNNDYPGGFDAGSFTAHRSTGIEVTAHTAHRIYCGAFRSGCVRDVARDPHDRHFGATNTTRSTSAGSA